MPPLSMQSAALHMPAIDPVRRRRWPLLLGLASLVAALHGAALWLFGPAWLDPEGMPPMAAPLQVRSLTWPAAPPAADAAAPGPRRVLPAATAPAVPAAPAVQAVAAPPEAIAAAEAPAPSPATDAVEIPVYATRIPPAGLWHFDLQRGLATGEAILDWSVSAADGYALHLQGRIAGMTLLDWVSRGALDAAGVAPERFVLRRRGRDAQAVNFQREAGKISFSGPRHEWPLLPGAQDRLSWLIQVPAIIAAAPERFAAGQRIVLFVAGARGDADVWVFQVMGPDAVGDIPALKLLREARKPYDIRVELWLDPAEHHLPLRIVQTPGGSAAALVLQRRRDGH